jgi:hypothetical protein
MTTQRNSEVVWPNVTGASREEEGVLICEPQGATSVPCTASGLGMGDRNQASKPGLWEARI